MVWVGRLYLILVSKLLLLHSNPFFLFLSRSRKKWLFLWFFQQPITSFFDLMRAVGSSIVAFYAYECFHWHDGYRKNTFKGTGIGTGILIFETTPSPKFIELSGPPYRTVVEPTLSLLMPRLLFPTSDPAAFPPSACNIHLGECCHDETHILMLTRTLPWALFTTSVTYHQIKSASKGWK